MTSFGQRLMALRKERELSVADLAAASEVPKPTIYRLEQGRNTPRAGACLRLATALGVSVDDLLRAPEPKRRASGGRR